jgi:HK97 family phage portal protein
LQKRSVWNRLFGSISDTVRNYTMMQLMKGFTPVFTNFGNDAYASDVVRSTVHVIASNAAKLKPKHIRRDSGSLRIMNDDIERLLSLKPNPHMNAYDFYYKIVTQLMLRSNAFILIQRAGPRLVGFYPVIASSVEALEYEGDTYLRFQFSSGKKLTVPYDDVIHLRRFFYESDLFGESNETALLPTLELINTSNQGISNAVKSSADLRGLLKYSTALRPEDLKKNRDEFVKDYMDVNNNGGVAAIDSKADYVPLNSNPKMVNAGQQKYIDEKVYKYFGVNENIVMSKYKEDEWNAFYESVIEPIAIQLSLEFTSKLFTSNERAHGHEIIYESNRLQYASVTTKLNLAQMVDRGAMTPNEWREAFNYAPLPGGDKPVRRLDTAEVGKGKSGDKTGEGGDEDDGKNKGESESKTE